MTLNFHTDLTNGEAGGDTAKALKPPVYSNYLFAREHKALPAESQAINFWGKDAPRDSKPFSHGWVDNLPNVSLYSPLDLQSGECDISACPHNFSEEQQRGVK